MINPRHQLGHHQLLHQGSPQPQLPPLLPAFPGMQQTAALMSLMPLTIQVELYQQMVDTMITMEKEIQQFQAAQGQLVVKQTCIAAMSPPGRLWNTHS